MKRCARCGETKPCESFGNRRAAIDGLHPWCKECVREWCRLRYQERKDEIKAAVQGYRDRNGEAINARARERYQANKSVYAERTHRYYEANREHILTESSRRGKENRESARESEARYREANREKRRDAGRRLYRSTPVERLRRKAVRASQVRRARKREAAIVPFTAESLDQKIRYWGEKCWMCGRPMEAIDHVKPLSKGGPHMLANLRPICQECNERKGNTWPLLCSVSSGRA